MILPARKAQDERWEEADQAGSFPDSNKKNIFCPW
jgi:hypothetical protein